MTSVRTVQLLGAAAAALALAACKPEAQADPRQTPRIVQTVSVKTAAAQRRSFTGVVAARVQSNLGFRVPGKRQLQGFFEEGRGSYVGGRRT